MADDQTKPEVTLESLFSQYLPKNDVSTYTEFNCSKHFEEEHSLHSNFLSVGRLSRNDLVSFRIEALTFAAEDLEDQARRYREQAAKIQGRMEGDSQPVGIREAKGFRSLAMKDLIEFTNTSEAVEKQLVRAVAATVVLTETGVPMESQGVRQLPLRESRNGQGPSATDP